LTLCKAVVGCNLVSQLANVEGIGYWREGSTLRLLLKIAASRDNSRKKCENKMRGQEDENSDLNTDETELELNCGKKDDMDPGIHCTLIVLFPNNFVSGTILIYNLVDVTK